MQQQYKSFARHFLGIPGWIALGALAFAALFLILGLIFSRNAARLESQGADAIAIVTELRTRRDSDGDTEYLLRYAFPVGADSIEQQTSVSYEFYRSATEGQEIPVRYWTEDPNVNELSRGASASMGWIGWIGAGIGGLAALISGRIAWQGAAQARWLARNGVRRQVTVTDHRETLVRVNGRLLWQALWREADGREGASRMAPRDRLPAIGSQITVLVDPQGQRPARLEADLLA